MRMDFPSFLCFISWPWLVSPFFVHHLASKGNVPCVLIAGLPCFPFPRAWKIALSGEFSSWLEIAGNALFLRVLWLVNNKSKKKFHSLKEFYWQFIRAVRLSPRCQLQRLTLNLR